jgi:hypothetical protein
MFRCSHCPRQFAGERSLNAHIGRCHREVVADDHVALPVDAILEDEGYCNAEHDHGDLDAPDHDEEVIRPPPIFMEDVSVPSDIFNYHTKRLNSTTLTAEERSLEERVVNKEFGAYTDLYVTELRNEFESIFGPGSLDCKGVNAEREFVAITQEFVRSGHLYTTDSDGRKVTVSGYEAKKQVSAKESAVLAWKASYGIPNSALDELNSIQKAYSEQPLYSGDTETVMAKLDRKYKEESRGQYWKKAVPWPVEWKMTVTDDNQNPVFYGGIGGAACAFPDVISLTGPFILRQLANMLSDPLSLFTWGEHVTLEASIAQEFGAERSVRHPMEGTCFMCLCTSCIMPLTL